MGTREALRTPSFFFALVVISILIFQPAASGDESEAVTTDVEVGIGTIARMTLRAYVSAYGTVEAEPARDGKAPASALVAAHTGGLIIEARCEEGRKVQRGQVLFSLEHRLADVQIDKALAALTLAEKNLQRKLPLSATGNVSKKLLDEARQQLDTARQDLALAQTQRALLQVEAPLNGTVVKINVRPGEAVGGNAVLAEVVDLDRLVANAAVPGAEVQRVRLDQSAVLSVAADNEDTDSSTLSTVKGTVSFIGLQVDAATAAVPVRIALAKDSGLRPGQFVQARIAVEERTERLAVPVESVVTLDGQSAIFITEGDQAIRTPVQLGLRDGDFVEVEGAGLQAGMNIVTAGVWGLPDRTRIHVIDR
ncbi:MAG: efflux RND transporter periplasmic adaptor subunit [Methylococcales bacterium]